MSLTGRSTLIGARIASLALAGGAALALAACGSSGGSAASGPQSMTSAGSGTSDTGATQPAAGGSTLTATETEFHIALSSTTLKAGTYTLHVKNAGTITHALTVDGPGIEDKSTGDLNAGDSGSLTVTLKPGTYEIYCPVGDHKMEGMDEKVQVR